MTLLTDMDAIDSEVAPKDDAAILNWSEGLIKRQDEEFIKLIT